MDITLMYNFLCCVDDPFVVYCSLGYSRSYNLLYELSTPPSWVISTHTCKPFQFLMTYGDPGASRE